MGIVDALGYRYRERGKQLNNVLTPYGTRELHYQGGLLQSTTYKDYPSTYAPYQYETCLDETHKRSWKDGKYHSGGPLLIRRTIQRTKNPWKSMDYRWGSWRSKYEGAMHLQPIANDYSLGFFGGLPEEDWGDPTGYGPEGFKRYKPGRAPLGLSVFLGELRDLPAMLQRRSYTHLNAGKHYLNAQFGWIPFLSDLKSMYDLALDYERRLQNIEKMNGKWHTRGGTLLSEEEIEPVGKDSTNRVTPADSYVLRTAHSSNTFSYVTSEKVWFKGRFCYYIPKEMFSRPEWRLNTIRKMYGLTITPDVVWNLTPWSWLIDYFANVGNILENVSDGYIDGVVSKYAYVMCHKSRVFRQVSCTKLLDLQPVEVEWERGHEVKHRVAGDPFAFDMGGDISAAQAAILTALGISRMGR